MVGFFAILSTGALFRSAGQTADLLKRRAACSPAPCVLPPTQASEGGAEVTDTPISANPLNSRRLVLGSHDFNCPQQRYSGFHVSNDGGATWSVFCMPDFDYLGAGFAPLGQPMVGHDLNGTSYIASPYGPTGETGPLLLAYQTSTDGVNWAPPSVALTEPVNDITDSWMTVDTNESSPFVNSLYFSTIVINEPQQNENQVVVAYSHDEGITWTSVNVAPVQKAPDLDRYTSLYYDDGGQGRDGLPHVDVLQLRTLLLREQQCLHAVFEVP